MTDRRASTEPWDETWQIAFIHFRKLAITCPQMAAVRDVIQELKDMPEIRGLFIKSSMFTAFITPYSCYPDFFDGRRITLDAGPKSDSPLAVRYLRDGFDKTPEEFAFPVSTASSQIAALCRIHL